MTKVKNLNLAKTNFTLQTEDVPGSTSGDFDGVTFENQPKCNYLMVAEHCVTLPPQFIDGDFCVVLSDDMRRTEMSGFVKKDKDLYYKLWSVRELESFLCRTCIHLEQNAKFMNKNRKYSSKIIHVSAHL